MVLVGNQVSKISVSCHFDSMLIRWHETLREVREPLCLSCFHFHSVFLHGLFKSLSSSLNHGHEEGVFFLYPSGAIESKIVVQELLKSLTNSSTERGNCRWLLRVPRIEKKGMAESWSREWAKRRGADSRGGCRDWREVRDLWRVLCCDQRQPKYIIQAEPMGEDKVQNVSFIMAWLLHILSWIERVYKSNEIRDKRGDR